MVLGKLGLHMQKHETRPPPSTLHNNWLKKNQGSESQADIIKLLEENIRETPQDIGIDRNFLEKTPEKQAIKAKID